ncbi:C-type lectin domain family 4 member M-like isoform X1 [Neolamprologus brichardi]|uniref:C-type lectin domain family 4 member M-like isoform X1 n=1 Tax=Neolamprologus brichardi TaxID=32507 RepID=UPI0003EC2888|nr:C-type lectin domain family 4 member M-like isoform X1 [Neolamprologus brichardi]
MTDFDRTLKMDAEREQHSNFHSGIETVTCEEDLHDEDYPTYLQSIRNQVSMFSVRSVRHYRLTAVSLLLLAAVLLILNIGLGVHYDKLTDTYFTLDDTERISKELIDLQDTYKSAVERIRSTKKRLNSNISHQKLTSWELEHQTKRSNDYKSHIDKITKEIETMRSYLPMLSDGCKHCPAGWILMNSVCYYFPLKSNEIKTWKESRDFCQLQGGDLIIIDSQDEENLTVNYLMNHQDAPLQTGDLFSDQPTFQHYMSYIDHSMIHDYSDYYEDASGMMPQSNPKSPKAFWIGLSDVQEDGTWKWWDGTFLTEGYWNDGEPNDVSNEDCAALYPKANFFKSWNDVRCDTQMKWICEKAPKSMS